MVGQQLLHYRVAKRLGKGGMGEVFLAEDGRLGRQVAIKVLHAQQAADRMFLERFTREAKAVAALNHPNIVTLHALEEANDVHFLVMEYVEGETLDVLIARRGASPGLLREFALKLADALIYAHDRGITHRDLKPANIMVSPGQRVKILDFGLAKMDPLGGLAASADAPTEMLTQDGSLLGTVGYMSPEQAQGQPLDARSDIFSLGVILYQLGTGKHPFPAGGAAAQIAAILRDEPRPPAEVEAGVEPVLNQVISRCLEKVPEGRFQTAAEIVAALEAGATSPTPATSAIVTPAVVAADEIRSVAVLPFADMSPERDNAYFCDGMAEELINGLSRIPDLSVASRSSAFRFRDEVPDIAEIGRNLGVQSVLEGSVRKAASRLRIAVQLVAVGSGYQLWSERFDREQEDVFAIQDDIARRVVDALELELGGDRQASVVSRQTVDLEAYHCYLKGRHQMGQRTEAGLTKSIELFKQAIDRDPSYSQAWAGLADAYTIRGLYGSQRPKLVMPKAKAAADRALGFEPGLAEAHVSLGCVLSLYEWEWEEAGRAFERALALDPGYATAHQWYAMNQLVPLGRFDQALEHAREAQRLDPLAPAVNTSVGLVNYFAGRFDDAVRDLRQVVELEPGFAAGRFFLGRALVELEEVDEAVIALEAAVELSDQSSEMLAALGHAQARRGEDAAARRLLDQLQSRARSAYVSPSLLAQIHIALGDRKRTIECLRQGSEEHTTDLAWLAVQPVFAGLRDDPAFASILARMGLAGRGSA